ncbi:C2 calcium-dependent domain-containing protein 6-like [Pygocentrus nattereri]|uniref:C2 calcium-dependent domain-containing protein 6-like n=1 Tax=Pygocentrus nattereri TaxID=42514 RepID=UPI001891766F|nr:C2 calcium-dependent domain-containing protein 6-like [Pygocentrus nattereri]
MEPLDWCYNVNLVTKTQNSVLISQVEPAAPSSCGRRMLQRVLSTVRSLVERLRSRSSARCIQAEVEDEHEEVSQPPQLIPLGVPAVNLKTCRDFSKSAPLKKGSRAAVRITIGRTVKYTVQQPYSDPMCFDEWKHFLLQIQKEDICGVQQSSSVVVELIMVDPDLTTPVLIGRDTIMWQEILKKSSLSHQFNLRLMQKKVCKLDADLAFSYGSMGYGYSHQIKHAGRTIESLVEKSLSPCCPPNED